MYRLVDFRKLIKEAWNDYDPTRPVSRVTDISAMVSTNHVFRVRFKQGGFVIAKCSYFGKFQHFKEDHTIINVLANNLRHPYEDLLAHSLTKEQEVYTYQYKEGILDAWVVFYNPITIDKKLPKKLNEKLIRKLGAELARFHQACFEVKDLLPPSSKTLTTDVNHLLEIIKTDVGQFEHRGNLDTIRHQCELFFENSRRLGYEDMLTLPVFVDWNIGNFSVTAETKFFARWDYDWFRVSSRVMDFYFFSRVCSSVGDKTTFSYFVDPLMEDRFIWFLEEYHKVFPLTEAEVRFIKEAYRFFILNYVIKDGRYFFHEIYSMRLQREAYETYFPMLDRQFDADRILKVLKC